MAYRTLPIDRTVASISGSTALSEPIYVGGNTFSVHVQAPASLALIEVSSDKLNWVSEAGTLADNTVTQVTGRLPWVRVGETTDVSGPRNFYFRITVFKEQDS